VPIYSQLRVNVDLELVPTEEIAFDAPLTWGDDRRSRAILREEIAVWLSAHPFRVNDEIAVIVEREILVAIMTVLQNPQPVTQQEVAIETVQRSIREDTQLTGLLEDQCLSMLHDMWIQVANVLLTHTKHAPADT
jgi:hypothetical protein